MMSPWASPRIYKYHFLLLYFRHICLALITIIKKMSMNPDSRKRGGSFSPSIHGRVVSKTPENSPYDFESNEKRRAILNDLSMRGGSRDYLGHPDFKSYSSVGSSPASSSYSHNFVPRDSKLWLPSTGNGYTKRGFPGDPSNDPYGDALRRAAMKRAKQESGGLCDKPWYIDDDDCTNCEPRFPDDLSRFRSR